MSCKLCRFAYACRAMAKEKDKMKDSQSDRGDLIVAKYSKYSDIDDALINLEEENIKLKEVLLKCKKSMEGSNCLELEWITKVLENTNPHERSSSTPKHEDKIP